MVAYKQIKSRKIYEEVADEILKMIKSGELKPGQKLDSVQYLAESFQVGRSAIREALSAIRTMGLIEMRQGEGTFVKEFDPKVFSHSLSTAVLMEKKDIKDLLEVRKILEAGSAASAATNRTEKDLEAIQVALEEMRLAVDNKELGEQADFNFHMAIAAATDNRLLGDLMTEVSDVMIESMRETRKLSLYSEKTILEKLYKEHQQIFEAIKEEDPNKAQMLMYQHLVEVENVLLKYKK